MKQKVFVSLILALSLSTPVFARGSEDHNVATPTQSPTHQEDRKSTEATQGSEAEHATEVEPSRDSQSKRASEQKADQQAKCTVRTDRINDHVARADKHIDERQKHEENLATHVRRVITKYEAAPYNVSADDSRIRAITTDLAQLKTQLDQNIADHQRYINDLHAIAIADCGSRTAARATALSDFAIWRADMGKVKPLHVKLMNDLAALISSANKTVDGAGK